MTLVSLFRKSEVKVHFSLQYKNNRYFTRRPMYIYFYHISLSSSYSLTYSLTPWCRVPLEKLTGLHLIKKFPTFHGTYLLTPWCRVPLEKLTGLHLIKKFPTFHGTRRFITALTSVRQLSLSWPAQSSPYTHIPPPGDPS